MGSKNLFSGLAGAVLAIVICAILVQAQNVPKTVVLKGSLLGPVTMDHALHFSKKIPCETCHHASKPEKPKTSPYEACENCHTMVAEAPMKTKLQAAFHDPMAKKGLCIDCHLKEAATGVAAPTKCMDCHKKASS